MIANVIILNNVKEYEYFDASLVTQVVEDWQKVPFVDVIVQDLPCSGEQEPVFFRDWGGTIEGCDIIEGDGYFN